MSLLKISAADFAAGNLCGDGQDGNAAAMTVVKAIDQMQVARAAASGANRQLASEMGFGSGGERRRLFMSHLNPLMLLSNANRICNSVERVARNSIDPFHASISKNLYQQFGYCFSHHIHPSVNKRYVLSECDSGNFATAIRDEGRRWPTVQHRLHIVQGQHAHGCTGFDRGAADMGQ